MDKLIVETDHTMVVDLSRNIDMDVHIYAVDSNTKKISN